MKKKLLFLSITICGLTGGALGKSLMPSLKKAQDKMTSALNSSTAISFKDYLAKSKIAPDLFPSKPVHEEVAQVIASLYWSNQTDFLKALEDRVNRSHHEACCLLKDKIKEKYSGVKMPLAAFAQALEKEEQLLKDLLTKILALTEKRQELFNRHTAISQVLQKLIAHTNMLLMS